MTRRKRKVVVQPTTESLLVIIERIPVGSHISGQVWRKAAISAFPSDWDDEAECRGEDKDPNDWFPERGENLRSRRSQKVCAGCACRDQCAAFGAFEPVGIWGGTTARNRIAVRGKIERLHKGRSAVA